MRNLVNLLLLKVIQFMVMQPLRIYIVKTTKKSYKKYNFKLIMKSKVNINKIA